MLDRLRVSAMRAAALPAQPARIKPSVNINDFRRFTAKVITRPNLPPAIPLAKAMPRPVLQPQRTLTRQLPPAPAQYLKGPLPKVVQAPQRTTPPRPSISPPKTPQPSGRIYKPPTILRTSHPPTPSTNSIQALKNIGRDRVLVMIAAGPSINEVNLLPLKDHPMVDFMCINQPHKPLWPTRFWAFCDHTQFRRNKEIFENYTGITINSTNVKARKGSQYLLNNRNGKGFALDLDNGYYIGRSSTYANMQVAHYMGYKKVYIFGVDMTDVNGRMHYYGQNPDVSNEKRKERFAAEAEHYTWAGRHLSSDVRGKFIFCSKYNPWPFIDYFSRLDHLEAVAKIIEYLSPVQK